MAVIIRLSKTGRRNAPYYRIVVADQRFKRDGKIIENVGNYNPRKDRTSAVVKKDRVTYWIAKGARPTPTVMKIIKDAGKVS